MADATGGSAPERLDAASRKQMRKPSAHSSFSWSAKSQRAQSTPQPVHRASQKNDSMTGTEVEDRQTSGSTSAHSGSAPATTAAAAPGSNLSAAERLRAKLGGKPKASKEPHNISCVHSANESSSGDTYASAVSETPTMAQASGRNDRSGIEDKHEDRRLGATGKKQKHFERFGADGHKQRHLQVDDEDKSIHDLVREQKEGKEPDVDAQLAANLMRKHASLSEDQLAVDEEYENDAGVDLLEEKQPKHRCISKQEQAPAAKTTPADATFQPLSERCILCFTNSRKPRHLHIAYGSRSYLMLPLQEPLARLQSRIVTMEHYPSMRMADEDIQQDVRNFKKSLVRMHEQRGEECLFLETARKIKQQQNHAAVDCIPLPEGSLQDAPVYFKKALEEEESDWATHAAKAVIHTSGTLKGLNSAIPEHFPYFHVEFGLGGGYVHVLDNESGWDPLFGHKVACSLLDEPELMARRKGKRWHLTSALQSQLREFINAWQPFDWTAELDRSEG